MKKIARKKSVVGSALRFGAAVPLCLMMLGGLSADANAAAGVRAPAGQTVDGVWSWDDTGTAAAITTSNVAGGGNGANSAAAAGANGGNTSMTGTPTSQHTRIIFGGVAGFNGQGGDSTNNFAGGNGGNTNWTSASNVTAVSMVTAGNFGNGGVGFTAGAVATNGGAGGKGGDLNINFGYNKVTLTGTSVAAGTVALDLVAGAGNLGGASALAAVAPGGKGGNGGNINFTSGELVANVGSVSFTAGNGANGQLGQPGQAGANTLLGMAGVGGDGGNVNINVTGIKVAGATATSNLTLAAGSAVAGAALSAQGGDGATTFTGQAGSKAGNGGNLTALVTGNISVSGAMAVRAGAGSAGDQGGDGGLLQAATGAGGAGGAGGTGGSTSLTSASITTTGALSFSTATAGAGGKAGDFMNAGNAGDASLAGAAGAGGVGGDAGNLTVVNTGTIKAAGALTVGHQGAAVAATGGAGQSIGAAYAGTAYVGMAGSAAGKSGAINITSNAIVADSNFDVSVIGGTGGAAGLNTVAAGGNIIKAGAGAAGAAGSTVNINANYITANNMNVTATGGNGVAGSVATNPSATNQGGNGGAGGAGGNVTFTGQALAVAGLLELQNADGNTPAQTAGLGAGTSGAGGVGGTITFNTFVTANDVVGTRGKAYYMRGFYLDAEHQNVTFSVDTASGAKGDLTASTLAPSLYNIATLRVDTNGANNVLNVNPALRTTYRQITADNLSKLNVASYDFKLAPTVKPGDTLLNVRNDVSTPTVLTDNFVVRNAAGVAMEAPTRIKNFHNNSFNGVNNKLTLVASDTQDLNIEAYTARRVTTGIYSFMVGAEGLNGQNSALVAYLDAIPGFTAYAQAQAARMAFVNQGMDQILNSGIYDLQKATEADDMGLKFFMSGYGSSQSYDTGADKDMDVEGTGFLAGMGWGGDMMDGQRLLVGAFMEGGFGNYDTGHDFDTATYNSDGSLSYLGLGMMAKYAFPFGLYFDASARVGSAKMTFNSDELGTDGYDADLDETSATYYGMHIGAGYEWQIDEAQSVDVNTRLLWTSLSSDDATSNYGDDVNFQSADSLRWRTGARYNYALDMGENGVLKPFVGLAFEQEFDGDATTKVDGRRTDDTPSLHGATGIGELGVSWQATKAFSLELAGQGYVGAREGGSGNLNFKWEF